MKKDKKINESLIGKIIYGFLMFAPLLAIMFTSLYATFNPNAKDSYSGTQTQIKVSYQYETNEVNTIDDLIVGNIYHYNCVDGDNYLAWLDDYTPTGDEYWDVITPFYNAVMHNGKYGYDGINDSIDNVYSKNVLRLAINDNEAQLCYFENILFDGNSNNYKFNPIVISNNELFIEFDFVLTDVFKELISYSWVRTNDMILTDYITKSNYLGDPIIEEKETEGTLDNAFYYALDKTEDSSLFNWSKNTGIYTVLYNACNGLGITTSFIPFILTYWLFISLIYLIYDLVLVFVHIAHKKVHELEDF